MNSLKTILEISEKLSSSMTRESQVWRAELEERQRLGLHGEAALEHYNEWMERYGMHHLKVTK